MGKKKSIYVGEELENYTKHHEKRNSFSGAINTMADRHQYIIAQEMPKLLLEEWSLIFDSLNGYFGSPANHAIRGIVWNVSDSINIEKLDEKWEIDGEKLKEKLANMAAANLLAILDASERWWGAVDGTHTDMDDSIRYIVGENNVL